MIDWSKVGFVGWDYLEKGIREYCEKLPEEIQSHINAVLATDGAGKNEIVDFSIRLSLDYGDHLECPFLETEKVTKVIFMKNEISVECATDHKCDDGRGMSLSYSVLYN